MKPKQGLIKQAGKVLKKASPTILSCFGVFGVIATAALAIKATPKALESIEDAKNAKGRETDDELTRMETIGACWKCYAPAAISGIATIGCILGANVLNRRQQASLASAYAILNKTYQDYRHSVKNVFGEEGHKRVLQDMAVERVPDNHTIYTQGTFQSSTLDFCVSEEERLFYDIYSDRQFTSTIGKVLQAEYHLNRMFAINRAASLNEFYNYLGIAPVPGGDDLIWVVDPENKMYWIDFNHDVTYMDDGLERPPVECLVIDFVTIP